MIVHGKGWAGCVVALAVLAGGAMVQGQQQVLAIRCGFGAPIIARPIQIANQAQSQDGFIVAAGATAIRDTAAGEALKLIEAGQWVKAIQAIESLSDAEHDLVLDDSGVLRPLSAMKSALIASMPQEGRRTFCKLNDPAANTKLAEALHLSELQARAQAFETIVNDYMLCDAAGQAAKHLGDIRFEQGRFNEAVDYYRFAAEHPATPADDPALMARRLIAMARAQQWAAFDTLATYAQFRHRDTAIALGGQSTPIPQLITQLVASRTALPGNETTTPIQKLALPDADGPEYDRPLIDPDRLKLLRQFATNHNLAGVIDHLIAPVVASDGKRLFTLALGSVARLDPQTGTELWRVGDPAQTAQQIQSRMHELMRGYHQSLVVHGDTLLACIPDPQRISTSHLVALDAETGEEKWNLRDHAKRNSNEGVVGQPLVVDGLIYYITYRSNEQLVLNTASLADGLPMQSLALGKASKGPHMASPGELSPRLAMGQGYLMVQTNNGALIAVEPTNMKIAWALSQKIRASGLGMLRRHGQMVTDALAHHTGDVVVRNGLVIAKDTRTNTVHALREYDAAHAWATQTDADATIVHADDRHVYILGEELIALNLRTGERVWWTPHPGDKADQPVFTKDACLIAGNHRFCRIDLSTGKLTQYREDLTDPAALRIVGQQLLSVTPQSIAAFRLP